VKFNITPAHCESNGAVWRRQQLTNINARKGHENAAMKHRRRARAKPTNNQVTRARLAKAKLIGLESPTV